MKSQAGFTLIEIIAVLLLVTVLGSVAGMGLVTGVKGYILARENVPTSQKAQVAIERMRRELMEIVSIASAGPSSIKYGHIDGNRAIGLVGDKIKIIEGDVLLGEGTGDVLIENVNNFKLSYYNGETVLSVTAANITDLTTIKIDLVLKRADSGIGTIDFSTSVNPRNTGNNNAPTGK